jgi:L-asparaginase II
MKAPAPAALLAIVTRGKAIESQHVGHICVVNAEGKILYSLGDPETPCFARSTLKPFQALPLLAHPGVGRFGFTQAEIAVMCASHSGEPRHVETVLDILKKIGCHRRELQCGVHVPFFFESLQRLPKSDDVFTPLHNNCSGKHAGMLALCQLLDAPRVSYLDPEHAVQTKIRAAVAAFCGLPEDALTVAIDGCNAPTFAMPLRHLALAYARLAQAEPDPHYGDAHSRIVEAMTAHPDMVAGVKRLDLALMHVGGGDWLAKTGAEAVEAIAVRSRGFGIAMKIADGANRALPVVAIEVLRQLGLIENIADTVLDFFAHPQLRNLRDVAVGEIRPIFRLV